MQAEIKVGERSADKLVDALVDTFSPATETLGLFGDVIRLARVEVAAQITQRAKRFADEAGLKLQAPPLKFLVPFFERASTEDASEDNLMDMWAKLLVAAGSEYDARQMRFASILAELSGEQARILDGIARNYDGVIGVNSDPDGLTYELVESRLVSRLKLIEAENPDHLIAAVSAEVCRPGVSVVIIQSEINSDREMWEWTGDQVYSDKRSLDFEILVSLGLLSKVATDFVETKHAATTVTLYHLSELGFGFWSACCEGPKGEPCPVRMGTR
ncbi:MAG TPA: Abi-alpha family protein [Phenylobacterium sp.]|nr:Abi-alpha family protein [Phenylobacterium sp.]